MWDRSLPAELTCNEFNPNDDSSFNAALRPWQLKNKFLILIVRVPLLLSSPGVRSEKLTCSSCFFLLLTALALVTDHNTQTHAEPQFLDRLDRKLRQRGHLHFPCRSNCRIFFTHIRTLPCLYFSFPSIFARCGIYHSRTHHQSSRLSTETQQLTRPGSSHDEHLLWKDLGVRKDTPICESIHGHGGQGRGWKQHQIPWKYYNQSS